MLMRGVSESLEVSGCRFWRFPTSTDARGQLTVAEFATMPFAVQRIFFISDVPPGRTRGEDAEKTGDKLLLAINGRMVVTIEDGTRKQILPLRDPNAGLLIPSKTWCAISQFSEGAMLAVFASLPYDEANQIRDYAEFLSVVKRK
jgi:UDP-2-acetamido-3-amino-2,3-dideoxy-glucuronate N-acetyltransferase